MLGAPAATLPPAADRAFAAVGHVPLAVALLAAAVRGRQEWEEASGHRRRPRTEPGGRSWEGIAADLARDADVYGTHPYATTFRALHIAVAALPADLRAALLGLAVFPPDTAIPVAAIARYWAHTRHGATRRPRADLDQLVAAEVLQRSGDTIGFHDLAHEYLLLHADALPTLHRISSTPTACCSTSPTSGGHCRSTSRTCGSTSQRISPVPVTATGSSPRLPTRRTKRSGSHGTGRTRAKRTWPLPTRLIPDDPTIGWWRAWLARHAHLFGQHPAVDVQPARVAGTTLAWLDADSSRPAAVRPARLTPLLPRPHLAVHDGLHAESTALTRVLVGHGFGVYGPIWSPDGTRLATVAADGTARIWDPIAGRTVTELTGNMGFVQALAWSPDGTHLATAANDSMIRIWNPTTGQAVTQLAGHASSVQALAWSPDGTRLAVANFNGAARTWNITTGQTLSQIAGHLDGVWTATWSPDGTRLAIAGLDDTVRIWNPTTGQTLTQLDRYARWVRAIAWSPDGTLLATGGFDARICDPTTGRTLTHLNGHTDSVVAVVWSPDGTHLATASDDGTVPHLGPQHRPDPHPLTGHTDSVRTSPGPPTAPTSPPLATTARSRIWDPTTGHTLTPSPATPTRCEQWPGPPTAPTSPPLAAMALSESGLP